MKILIECSVLWILVCCVVAQSDVNDVSSLHHVVSEILRRLDEKDAGIVELQQRLVEQDAIIEKLQQRLLEQETLKVTRARFGH